MKSSVEQNEMNNVRYAFRPIRVFPPSVRAFASGLNRGRRRGPLPPAQPLDKGEVAGDARGGKPGIAAVNRQDRHVDRVPAEFLPFLGALVGYPYVYTRDPELQRRLIKFRIEFYRHKGTRYSLERILAVPEREELARLREIPAGEFASRSAEIGERLQAVIRGLKQGGAKT